MMNDFKKLKKVEDNLDEMTSLINEVEDKVIDADLLRMSIGLKLLQTVTIVREILENQTNATVDSSE